MTKLTNALAAILAAAVLTAPIFMGFEGPAAAATRGEDLNADAAQALNTLMRTNPIAADISRQARAVLVFPSIVKAGFIFGGAYGEGTLKQGADVLGYYNSFSASWGLQAGAQSYGYAVFLMNDKALEYLDKSEGWEIGVGPTVVIVNEGAGKNFSTTTLKDDAYAFIFDQKGLMAGISLEGSKISKIKR